MTSTTDYEDPFAGADADEDEFATPKTSFLALHDPRLEGRLLVLDVVETKTMHGVDGDYDVVVCNVVLPDGDPIPEFVPTIPGLYARMYVNAKGVVDQLKPLAGSGKPFLCRPDVIVNKRKQRVAGVRKHEITDADKALARPAWRAYKTGGLV